MKKVISILAVATFLFTVNVSSQEKEKEAAKKDVAKTEKSCSTAEKKSCSKEAGKKSCCAAKKTEAKAELAQ
jgi:hypothetical protein